MDRLLYSVPEACRFLSLSRSKVYGLMASGRLRSVKIDGARRLRAVDLAAYVESLSTPAPFGRGSGAVVAGLSSPAATPPTGAGVRFPLTSPTSSAGVRW